MNPLALLVLVVLAAASVAPALADAPASTSAPQWCPLPLERRWPKTEFHTERVRRAAALYRAAWAYRDAVKNVDAAVGVDDVAAAKLEVDDSAAEFWVL